MSAADPFHRLILGLALLGLAFTGTLLAQLNGAQQEAEFHYRVAMIAFEKNDLKAAIDEMNKAVDSAPDNASLYYNLALFQSKANRSVAATLNLEKAMKMQLPADRVTEANTLRASLAYEVKDSPDFSLYVGTWTSGVHRYYPSGSSLAGDLCGFEAAEASSEIDASWAITLAVDAVHPDKLVGKSVLRGNVAVKDQRHKQLCSQAFSRLFSVSVKVQDAKTIQASADLAGSQGAKTHHEYVFESNLEGKLSPVDHGSFAFTIEGGDWSDGFDDRQKSHVYQFAKGGQ